MALGVLSLSMLLYGLYGSVSSTCFAQTQIFAGQTSQNGVSEPYKTERGLTHEHYSTRARNDDPLCPEVSSGCVVICSSNQWNTGPTAVGTGRFFYRLMLYGSAEINVVNIGMMARVLQCSCATLCRRH